MGYIKAMYNKLRNGNFSYSESRYGDFFLTKTPVASHYDSAGKIPRKIFCFWTGENEMSDSRKQVFEIMLSHVGVPVELITPKKLPDYILPGHPVHKGYEYLSLIQKSDYLRCYFMHHHGGGYTDIKAYDSNWTKSFDRLEANPKKWIIGYREIGERGVAQESGPVGADLRKYWHQLLGNGAFICKPYTPFTFEWYTELHCRMDYFYDELVKHPGDAFGDNTGYPIKWAYIMGYIFHPLCLKYNNRLMFSKALKFKPMNYR
ncbi:MAG TPA: hypothetical protein VLH37_03825 [Bacteroidales bacterium]|nr:hypothetical protein [Bacteroidales bacterium]